MNEHMKTQIRLFREMQQELKKAEEFYIYNVCFEEEIEPEKEHLRNKRQERRRTFFNSLRALSRKNIKYGELVRWKDKYWTLQGYEGNKAILFSHHGKRTVLASQLEFVE